MIGTFYQVASDIDGAPVSDYLMHGYETRYDFIDALWRIVDRWNGRVGESVDERHGFMKLRFHDTPGGKPDEEWLPGFLLRETDTPEYMLEQDETDELTEEIDRAFGFD